MSWLKNNGIWMLVLLLLGFLVFRSFSSFTKGIDLEVQNKLDSINTVIAEKSTENKFLLNEINDLEKEKQELLTSINEKLSKIQPNYNKTITEYNKSQPGQKKALVNGEFERRKNEMNTEFKNMKNK